MALQQDGQDFALYPKQSRQGFKPPSGSPMTQILVEFPSKRAQSEYFEPPGGGGVLGLMFAGYVPLAP